MFGRIRAWSRRHPKLVDALWVAPLVLLCLGVTSTYVETPLPRDNGLNLGLAGYLIVSGLLLAPLFWRNSHPRTVFAVVALVSFGEWLARIDPLPANFAVPVALFAVATRCSFRWALAAGLVTELGVLLALIHWHNVTGAMLFSGSIFVVTVWITGMYANTRRRYLESLEERAERAERERDQEARLAGQAERTRIARELHDVVAHNVSVIIVQADGAGYAIDSDPEQARQAVQAIARTGREALAEMRRLVGVLRQDAPWQDGPRKGAALAADYGPQPGLAQLAELVRGSGLPVELRVDGTPVDLPEGEQLAAYRIVQEALTNTLKHGGPDVRAVVEMEYTVHELVLRITDDGRGAAVPRTHDGHGLIGMRERVGMYGGALTTGPRQGGGFEVHARLPVPASRAA